MKAYNESAGQGRCLAASGGNSDGSHAGDGGVKSDHSSASGARSNGTACWAGHAARIRGSARGGNGVDGAGATGNGDSRERARVGAWNPTSGDAGESERADRGGEGNDRGNDGDERGAALHWAVRGSSVASPDRHLAGAEGGGCGQSGQLLDDDDGAVCDDIVSNQRLHTGACGYQLTSCALVDGGRGGEGAQTDRGGGDGREHLVDLHFGDCKIADRGTNSGMSVRVEQDRRRVAMWSGRNDCRLKLDVLFLCWWKRKARVS